MPVDVLTALKRLEGNQQFDFIFMDPPYRKGLEREALEYLAEFGASGGGGCDHRGGCQGDGV